MMKWFRQLLFIALLAVVAALGILFWPRVRETWDRWLTAAGDDERKKPEQS